MASPTLVATECDHLDANLRAMDAYSSGARLRIAAMPNPENVLPVAGRDGAATYRINGHGERRDYLGRTSMPAVRAAALVDAFTPDGNSTLVPAIGTGYEIRELLSRGSGVGAVFVHDRNWPEVRLALTLHDFTGELGSGRLVILSEDDLEKSLLTFFEAFPGYEFPRRMFAPPYLQRTEIEVLRSTVQRTAAQVARMQADRIAAYGVRLREPTRTSDSIRRLALVSIDPRANAAEAAGALRAAASRCGIEVVASVPDLPARCHALARMQALASGDAALLLNCGWGPLREHVPTHYPAVTWLLPEAKILRGMTDGFDDDQPVFVATPELEQQVRAFGANAANIRILDVAVDDEVFRPAPPSEGAHNESLAAVCVSDLPDIRAAALNIDLETHVHLWERVCRTAADRPEAAAETILDAAQRASGVTIREEHLRDRFAALIRDRLLPVIHTRIIVESLLASRVDVRVFGAGWEQSRVQSDRVSPAPTTAAERSELYNRAAVVVCPVFDQQVPQVCLEVVAVGTCVVLREPETSFESLRPGLADVLAELPHARDLRSFIQIAGCLARDAGRRKTACRQARANILDRHLWSHRIETLLETLAERCVAP